MNYEINLTPQENQSYVYSKQLFNMWDWDIKSEQVSNLSINRGVQGIKTTQITEEALKKLNERSLTEWRLIYLRRLVLITINFCFLFAGWYAIILS